jgi:hypothetical protein
VRHAFNLALGIVNRLSDVARELELHVLATTLGQIYLYRLCKGVTYFFEDLGKMVFLGRRVLG